MKKEQADLQARKTNEIFDDLNLSKPIKSLENAVKLMIFNELSKGNQFDINKLKSKISRIINIEGSYQQNQNRVTIGTELECPEDFLDKEKRDILNLLDIPNKFELNNFDPLLWEVRPTFSYSHLIQTRILNELIKLGAVQLDENGKIPKGIYSLHINLGVLHKGGNEHDISIIKFNLQKDIEIFMKALNYAFTSPERIINRGVDRFYKVTKDDTEKPFLCRIESTATEFNEFTNITLKVAQNISTMLLTGANEHYSLPLDQNEKMLFNLWQELKTKLKMVFEKYGVNIISLERKHSEQTVKILKETDLKNEVLRILLTYNKKITKILE